MKNRVWINIGAEQDASFVTEKTYKVGDLVDGMLVQFVDLDKQHVLVKPAAGGHVR